MKAFVNAKLVFPDEIREGNILVENGKILASGDVLVPQDAEVIDMKGQYVGPGLFDIHNHGYLNTKTGEAYTAMKDPISMAKCHLRSGTTSITPSVSYGCTIEAFQICADGCRKAMESGETTIVGMHYEGPFTNPQYGANSTAAWQYSKELCEEVFNIGGDLVLHCTYAPELECAPELEDFLNERGIVMDMGHTAMTPADCERAVSKGAKNVTHLFDAMGCYKVPTGSLAIQETSSLAALSYPGVYYELICDSRGIHVKPHAARFALRCAGEDYIILVSDSTAAATYHDPSQYEPEDPRSAIDLNYNKSGQLSGSRLRLSGSCANFMRFTGCDVRVAFKCASTNPAKLLKLDHQIGSILPGRDANLVVVDDKFNVQDVYFHGELVQEKEI